MIHSLSRRKSLELNFRGIQFKKFCFLFFSLKGPVSAFICLFFTLISLIRFTGERGEGLLRQRMFSGLFFLLFYFSLTFGKWLSNRGYWLEKSREIWEKVEYGNLLLFKEKKYWWPWTVSVFPNHSWCGENRKATPPTPPPPAEEASGNITKRRQQTF